MPSPARCVLPLACAMLLALPLAASAQDITVDPAQVRLEVDDIRRFADALREIHGGASDTVAVLERVYIANASPGFRAYAERYGVTAGSIAGAISENPLRFANPDALADSILAQERVLHEGFRRLQELFPRAAYPPVWFVIGHNGPGGMTQRVGVIVAAERFANRPRDIVPLVMHELAHFQQAMVQGVETYQQIYGPEQTLLKLALREGGAELVAELTTGAHINPAAERYGTSREAALWAEFRADMHDRDPGEWMFVRPADPERPPDLGYWIGYRIARAYYDNAQDKAQALLDILSLTDFEAFVAKSNYSP